MIDEQGYMVLNPPRSDQVRNPFFVRILVNGLLNTCINQQSLRSVTKRYHFSDFQLPFIPDQDRQELPNSKFYPAFSIYYSIIY